MTTPTNPHFAEDPRVENLLLRKGLKFQLANVPAGEIDFEAGKNNQARRQALDDDRVARFAELMTAGVVFPALVLLRPKGRGESYIPLGGNHRGFAGLQCGLSPFLAYVVTTEDEQVIRLLPVLLNVIEGERTPVDERVEHAIFAVKNYAWPTKRAAEEFSISVDRINRVLHTEHARQRLTDVGAHDTSRVSDSALAELDLVDNDRVMLAIFEVAAREHLTLESTREFIRASRQGRTEAAALEEVRKRALDQFPEPPPIENGEPAARPRPPRTNKGAIYRSILNRHLNFLKDYPTLTRMGVTDKREKEWFHQKRDELMRLLKSL